MQKNTKNNTYQCAEHGKDGNLHGRKNAKVWDVLDGKPLVGNTKQVSNSVCDKRTDHTWNKGGIVHDADTYNFHWKDGSSHRGTKESGKRSTHAAHDHNMLVLVVKMKQFTNSVTDASAKLQSRTLTSCRTARKVGEYSA